MNKSNPKNLGELFSATVALYEEETALVWDDDTVTYGELYKQSNSLAGFLNKQGCTQGDVVAIAAEKQTSIFALLLACLRLGAPYVMLDVKAPKLRQQKIIEKCRPSFFIANPESLSNLTSVTERLQCKAISTDSDKFLRAASGSHEQPATVSCIREDQSAYIMFTSGSTGFPKGAVMTHKNVMLLISWSRELFGFGPGEILTNVNPLFFDNSVFDIYSSLFTGAALAPFEDTTIKSPGLIINALDKRGCTSWFSVPSLLMYLDSMKGINEKNMQSIRRFIFGGEGYPKVRLKKLFDTYGHKAELVNVYGPTECTCISSAYWITNDDFNDLKGFPPLGSMIKNFDFLVLDDKYQKVASGVPGELYLIGPCVGKGYYNDPERTSESFVPNPFNTLRNETIYRTGDIVHLDSLSGKIHIIGRKDNQIKHMGYRIELEEIENALLSVPEIKQAVAVQVKHRGRSTIVAVVRVKEKIDKSKLKKHLQLVLPTYMLPSEIFFKESIPHSRNGKIDRQQVATQVFENNTGC